ncbi:hypothetical protein PoB_002177400 [Plakobranchus ocellatus]|uniref:Uncharacterized protein n=1 Tax=Plakobranchus ocellatus TaxID=259542 RepID=A0AAV3ZLN1_9GAST|nr:hypothetical protein PoB_002177400 [Plakobranchus ocellatus]
MPHSASFIFTAFPESLKLIMGKSLTIIIPRKMLLIFKCVRSTVGRTIYSRNDALKDSTAFFLEKTMFEEEGWDRHAGQSSFTTATITQQSHPPSTP